MAPRDPLGPTLRAFFRATAPLEPGDRIVVGFSGGADSLALLIALQRMSSDKDLSLHAAHFNHRCDPRSGERAKRAAELARCLGVPFSTNRLAPAPPFPLATNGPEAAWREARYRFLESERRRVGGRWIAVAHHLDDQVETVLLRIAYGSGVRGVAAIPPRRGQIVRPFLTVERDLLLRTCAEAGLKPIEDPGNRDLGRPRNRLRHQILPHLRRTAPAIDAAALALARAASSARRALDARLLKRLEVRREGSELVVESGGLTTLPRPLFDYAVGVLHQAAGEAYPPRRRVLDELHRQLSEGGAVGCDCSTGLRWTSEGRRIRLGSPPHETPRFQYTLTVPGVVNVPELSLSVGLEPGSVAPWMMRGQPHRAGLHLPLQAESHVVVRNRRAGDRIQPLGCTHPQQLKKLLIDRKLPRRQRDRLPLLFVDGELAWVPGVTIAEPYRICPARQAERDRTIWIAEIKPDGNEDTDSL